MKSSLIFTVKGRCFPLNHTAPEKEKWVFLINWTGVGNFYVKFFCGNKTECDNINMTPLFFLYQFRFSTLFLRIPAKSSLPWVPVCFCSTGFLPGLWGRHLSPSLLDPASRQPPSSSSPFCSSLKIRQFSLSDRINSCFLPADTGPPSSKFGLPVKK